MLRCRSGSQSATRTIRVAERWAGDHFADVGRRMKLIRIAKIPSQDTGKFLANRGLATAGHAHEQHNHGSWNFLFFGDRQALRIMAQQVFLCCFRHAG